LTRKYIRESNTKDKMLRQIVNQTSIRRYASRTRLPLQAAFHTRIPHVYGKVHSIETFTALDGPGIRMMLFLQGCHLRCKFCSNPDTWDINKGDVTSSKDIAKKMKSLYPYLKSNGSGITCSGGEPLVQADFVSALFQEAKALNLTTCLDTAGQAPYKNQLTVLPHTDLVLLCVKHLDQKKYKELTGVYPHLMYKFLDNLLRMEKPFYIRYVILPGYTDSEKEIADLIKFTKDMGKTCKGIELLPYHRLGTNKWKALNLCYPLEHVELPSKEHVDTIHKLMVNEGLNVIL
jgi:pyruvate formate lyase activating enzyme